MNEIQQIFEKGWWTNLVAPETDAHDLEARLKQVEAVLSALVPIFRPLALEVDLCWRELDTGLPALEFPEPSMCSLVLEEAQNEVAIRSTVQAPPPFKQISVFNSNVLRECINSNKSSDPNLVLDWSAIRSIAAAVYTYDSDDKIAFEELEQPVPAYQPNWFAGPVGNEYFEKWPPATLNLYAEERVRFTLIVYWSRWLREGSQERKSIEQAISTLVDNGWYVE